MYLRSQRFICIITHFRVSGLSVHPVILSHFLYAAWLWTSEGNAQTGRKVKVHLVSQLKPWPHRAGCRHSHHNRKRWSNSRGSVQGRSGEVKAGASVDGAAHSSDPHRISSSSAAHSALPSGQLQAKWQHAQHNSGIQSQPYLLSIFGNLCWSCWFWFLCDCAYVDKCMWFHLDTSACSCFPFPGLLLPLHRVCGLHHASLLHEGGHCRQRDHLPLTHRHSQCVSDSQRSWTGAFGLAGRMENLYGRPRCSVYSTHFAFVLQI